MSKKIPSPKKNMKKLLTTGSTGIILSSSMFFPGISSTSAGGYSYPALPFPYVADCINCNNTTGPVPMTVISSATCNHASGIVNGHFSSTPTVNLTNQVYNLYSHASHSSSGSGGGGGWC